MSRNLVASVQARLLNLARAQQREYGQVLTRFALERLLYRLGISEHADKRYQVEEARELLERAGVQP